jgi:hypothetical protein
VVRSVTQVTAGERLAIRVSDGEFESTVGANASPPL